MLLAEKSGGLTINYRGVPYTWDTAGSAIEVPDAFGAELLAIRGADFYVPEDKPQREITEPAPAAKAAVTEPAPKASADVAEGPAKNAPAK